MFSGLPVRTWFVFGSYFDRIWFVIPSLFPLVYRSAVEEIANKGRRKYDQNRNRQPGWGLAQLYIPSFSGVFI